MSDFKVGDIIEAFGLRGVIRKINPTAAYPVFVEYEDGFADYFRLDGRKDRWHKTASLVLVERPKPKIVKIKLATILETVENTTSHEITLNPDVVGAVVRETIALRKALDLLTANTRLALVNDSKAEANVAEALQILKQHWEKFE